MKFLKDMNEQPVSRKRNFLRGGKFTVVFILYYRMQFQANRKIIHQEKYYKNSLKSNHPLDRNTPFCLEYKYTIIVIFIK